MGIVAGIILVSSKNFTYGSDVQLMVVRALISSRSTRVTAVESETEKCHSHTHTHTHKVTPFIVIRQTSLFTHPLVCFLCCVRSASAVSYFSPGVASVVSAGWGRLQGLSLCLHPSMLLRERGQGPSV